MDASFKNLETHQANMGESMKNLETQVGQLTQPMKPSDIEKKFKDCMVITLWSGKELGDSKNVESEIVEAEKEDDRVENEENKEECKFNLGRIFFPENPFLITPPLSFP